MLYLVVMEICNHRFGTQTKIIFRFKDDIYFIPRRPELCHDHATFTQFITSLHPGFGFKETIDFFQAEICDVLITKDRNTMKLETSTYSAPAKKISYINKSSNVRQSPNAWFKSLQQRYIIIESKKRNYMETKKKVCSIMVKQNEWTPYDIRRAVHLKYEDRNHFIEDYLIKKKAKYQAYIDSKSITLFSKIWKSSMDRQSVCQIKGYLTYQKTLIDHDELNHLINESLDILPFRDEIDVNIYYKYQPSLSKYT